MTTIAEVRDAIATAITTETGLRSMAYASSSIPHPVAVVTPGSYDPRFVLGRAKAEYSFTVTVFLGPASERSVQKRCDQIREASGEKSIVAAMETSAAWEVDVDYAMVIDVGQPSEVVIAEEALMVVEFEIEVVF